MSRTIKYSMKKTHTISELENITGVRRRTIHFYVQQGFLPAPFGIGGAAKYGEEHILRLILIKEMQNSHLKLSGIKEALDAMSVQEMRELAGKTGGAHVTWDPQTVERWVAHNYQDGDSICNEESSVSYMKSPTSKNTKEDTESFSFLDALDKARTSNRIQRSGPKGTTVSRQMRRHSSEEPVLWERIILADGVELHVRSDRYDRSGDKMARLIDYCKKIF